MRMMEEDEQREALEKIIQNKIIVETKLHNLPLIVETPSSMRLKTESAPISFIALMHALAWNGD